MIPKVNFIYSPIYQEIIHSSSIKSEKYNYQEYKEFTEKFIQEIEGIWKGYNKDIFEYLEKISGLNWKKREINFYVSKISSIPPFSDPLTIPIQIESKSKVFILSKERFIDMFIHELIHNLLIQNKEKTEDYFIKFLSKKYFNKSHITQSHLVVHAIHKKIFKKFFKDERLDLEIKMNEYYPEYKRSWEIVNKEGEDKIIDDFRDYLGLPKAKA